jgi:hypothetical protein
MLYVATMYRWGCKENHSYVLGVFDKLELAQNAADKEQIDRGGKYFAEVIQCKLNEWDAIDKDTDWKDYFRIMYSPEMHCKQCEDKDCWMRKLNETQEIS